MGNTLEPRFNALCFLSHSKASKKAESFIAIMKSDASSGEPLAQLPDPSEAGEVTNSSGECLLIQWFPSVHPLSIPLICARSRRGEMEWRRLLDCGRTCRQGEHADSQTQNHPSQNSSFYEFLFDIPLLQHFSLKCLSKVCRLAVASAQREPAVSATIEVKRYLAENKI